jgi:hypothetical protein
VSVLKDLRALGAGAVPRAAYEMSKRTGAHRFAFGAVGQQLPLTSSGLSRLAPADSAAAQACLRDAKEIVAEGLVAFGRRVPMEEPTAWITDPESGRVWPQEPWWMIDIRSDQRMGDVKWVWEIGRHRELVILARAAVLEPDNIQWCQHLDQLLSWWCDANPLERSIHWYSNLEIALRLIAWDQVLGLAGDQLSQSTLDAMGLHVAQMRRHLWRDLPYTLSSMHNNHTLGDALGLIIADQMTGRTESRLRRGIAERMWQGQFSRQVNPDGSMIEDSLSYHRFVLEMFIVKHLLGDRSAALLEGIGNSSRYLAELGALDGPLPQFGDWDEGRVLATSGDPLDVGNSVALGLVISGHPEEAGWRERFDLLDWYAPRPADVVPPSTAGVRSAAKVGDIVTAKRGPWQVWLKCGTGPSHGHADVGQVSARHGDAWVLVDPGTGTYNGPLSVRNGFRTSHAHNVLRPLGEGQIEPHRAFRWMSTPRGVAGRVWEFPSATVMWGAHNAFVKRDRSRWPWRIARACVVTDTGLVVMDWCEGGDLAFEMTIPFGPQCSVGKTSVVVGDVELDVCAPGSQRLVKGSEMPFEGWFSPTYGSWQPAPWLMIEGAQDGPIWWSLGDVAVDVPGDQVTVGDVSAQVDWTDSGATLSLWHEGNQTVDDVFMQGAR